MLKHLLDFGRQLLALTRKTEQHETDVREVREELKEMRAISESLQTVRPEHLVDRALASRDQENLVLRLENALLRIERGIPPGGAGEG